QHPTVLGAQFCAAPLPERGRGRPKVDCHVKNCAPSTAYQLCLEGRRDLQMQSSNCSHSRAELHVGLDWHEVDPLPFKFPRAPSSHKAATFIVMRADIDDPSAHHWGLLTPHRRFPPTARLVCGQTQLGQWPEPRAFALC